MYAILQKELKFYFTSLFTYIYIVIFFGVAGLFTYANCVVNASTEFGMYVLSKCIYVVLFFVPLCTMRQFAQEKKERTDQMLFTAPVSNVAILTGKLISTIIVVLVPIFASVFYLLWMSAYGTVSVRYSCSVYFACILTVVCFILVGVIISILSSNSIIAAVATYAIYAAVLLLRILEGVIDSAKVQHFISDYSVYNRFNDMISGVIRTRDLFFICSLIICMYLIALILLDIRRKNVKVIPQIICVVVVGIIFNVIGVGTNNVYDLTADSVITLSEETKEIISKIDSPTKIIYLGRESRANITYKELLNCYAKLNDNIEVIYEEMSEDSVIRVNYLSDLSHISEASLLVLSEKKQLFLDSNDYLSKSATSQYSYKTILNFESMLTSAVYSVNTENEEGIITFNGADELPIPATFENSLMMNDYKLKNVDLTAQAQAIQNIFMDDYKIAFANSPKEDYTEEELYQLDWFMEHGGNVVITLDPVNEEIPNIYNFLKKYGLEVQSGIVYEGNSSFYANETPYYLVPYTLKTSYTEDLLQKNMQVMSMTSKGIRCVGTENGYTASEVLVTSEAAYSKLSNFESFEKDEENDISGPFALAAVSEKEGKGSLFVITTNIMMNDEEVDRQSGGANRQFLVNVLNSLVGKENGVVIPKKEVRTQVANYPIINSGIIKIMMIAVIPCVILALGIIIVGIRHSNILLRKKSGGISHDTIQKEE